MESELNAVVNVELESIVKLRCTAINCKHHMIDRDCCNYKILDLNNKGECLSYCPDNTRKPISRPLKEGSCFKGGHNDNAPSVPRPNSDPAGQCE